MKKETIKLSASQFAKLHKVNKRTLHYYDEIGLFSPKYKGENLYRYYDYSQSMDFEYIRMLKELNLSIKEIRSFINNFREEEFLNTIISKQKEIDCEIQKLKRIKSVLSQKQELLLLCQSVKHMEIRIVHFKRQALLTVPYTFETDDFSKVFQDVLDTWSPEQYRCGVGSYISLEKIAAKQYADYDGLFSPTPKASKTKPTLIRPQGTYLCGYLKGSWQGLPALYQKMLAYASDHHLSLSGYAYELGINDFLLPEEKDYITQISILILP